MRNAHSYIIDHVNKMEDTITQRDDATTTVSLRRHRSSDAMTHEIVVSRRVIEKRDDFTHEKYFKLSAIYCKNLGKKIISYTYFISFPRIQMPHYSIHYFVVGRYI